MTDDPRSILTHIGTLTGRPTAFVIVGLYVLGWLILSPRTLEWHSIATVATWLMTLFIQRAEHRDTQAIHAKLDELIKATEGARDEVVRMDNMEPEKIEQIRGEEPGRD